ncbi:MAG: radical SAM protein [Acidobacteria bacterium]|nr:radical SAM protein [Acidobacteriota bacterium]
MDNKKHSSIAEFFDSQLSNCNICPHGCCIDRKNGEKGFCRTGIRPIISSFGPHFGEERELVGLGGSGTIFFTSCNLACQFCQNYDISQQDEGKEISIDRLGEIMLSLQKRGCENINLVTPTHQLHAIIEAIDIARTIGLSLPIVYNCGGYEKPETIQELKGYIDIYMPDFKWGDNKLGKKYSKADNYFDYASVSILEMYKQAGSLETNSSGIATKGLLIRHLVMPGMPENTEKVIDFIAENLPLDTYINIMAQYHPAYNAYSISGLHNRLTSEEYKKAIQYAREKGLQRGF